MGQMKVGYGSEFHLLRFLGRHRQKFDSAVLRSFQTVEAQQSRRIEWLDYPFDPREKTRDGECKSVDFLPGFGGEAWKQFWPDKTPGRLNRRGMPSWDAIGQLHFDDHSEWLLVEAKAHEAEFASPRAACEAGDKSLIQITRTLSGVYAKLSDKQSPPWDDVESKWLGRYYQIANRLAVLSFLLDHKSEARLLFVYFTHDELPGKRCPRSPNRWRELIADAYKAMGLPTQHEFTDRIHYLFPNVRTGVCT